MESLEQSGEARFLQLASNSPECYWLIDAETQRLTYISKAYEQIWGRHVDDLYDNPDDWLKFIHPEDLGCFVRHMASHHRGGQEDKFRVLRADGSIRWLHVRTFPLHDEAGALVSIGGVASDVTSLLHNPQQKPFFAHFDALTALPNQLMFYDQARRLLSLSRRKGLPLGILVIDIDRFREVNQTLGFLCGDQLLRQVAQRLQSSLRESDILGRLGGDVYAVLLPDVEEIDQAAVVARRLTDTLAMPLDLDGRDVFVTVSIGVVFHPQHGNEVHQLIKCAEIATQHAKAAGRNGFQFYVPSMQEDGRERLFLETDLHNAVLREEFMLYYQPKVSCVTGQITGAEALIRWNHPVRGIVPPDQFIPLLEETGLIVPVGRWALETACKQIVAWRQAGFDLPSVSVNLSARQLLSDTLLSDVAGALEQSGLDAASLDLEITESMLMNDANRAISILSALKKTGVTLSLDDFGTGYSSLAYLKRFPLDALKVDRSFVQDIAADADDASITRAVITMAHHLKLKVVAEGVETAEQLALLMSHQCDMIQGYFFSRPLAVGKMADFLASNAHLPANMLRSSGRKPTALFVAVDGFDELISVIQRDGYQVSRLDDFDEAMLWLAGNPTDVLVCGSPRRGFDAISLIRNASMMQHHGERILLVDDHQWHQKAVADLASSGVVHRVLRMPVEPSTLQILLEEVLAKRYITEEYSRLSHAMDEVERKVVQLTAERDRLQEEHNDKARFEGQGFHMLHATLDELPWPAIGVGEDGQVALANEAAILLLATSGLSLGDDLQSAWPQVYAVNGQGQVEIDHQTYACWWRRAGNQALPSGRLLLLQKI